MLYDINLPELKEEKTTDNSAQFVLEPLFPGYGMTLGNSMRRVRNRQAVENLEKTRGAKLNDWQVSGKAC